MTNRNSSRGIIWGASALVMALSLLAIAGSLFGYPLLASVRPEWNGMRIATALCLIACAVALLIVGKDPKSALGRRVAQALAFLVMAVGAASLMASLWAALAGREMAWTEAPILQPLFGPPSRMASLTALVFVGMGAALALIGAGTRRHGDVAHVITVPIALASYLVPLADLYGFEALNEWMHVAMAFNTGIAFCALSAGLLFAAPDTWLMRVFTHPGAGNTMGRRLLPAIAVLPLFVGWLRFLAVRERLLDPAVGDALAVFANTLTMAVILWAGARVANAADGKRGESERALRARQEELQRSEATLRGILTATQESIWLFDTEGTILTANETALQRFGRTGEELFGRHFSEFMSGQVAELRMARLQETVRSGRPVEFEDERNGMIFHHTFYPVSDGAGHVTSVVSFSREVTQQKRAGRELAAKHEELQTILDSVPAAIFYKDKENRFLHVNEGFAKMMGAPREQLEGRSLFDLYPKDQAEAYWRDDREVLRTGRPSPAIMEPVATSRGERWVQTHKVPYRDANGETMGVIGFSVDFTERKRAEEALAESRRRLSVIVDSIADGFFAVDRDWRFTHVNEPALRHFGKTRGEMEGRGLFEVFPAALGNVYEAMYRKAMETGEPVHFEARSTITGGMLELHCYPGPDNMTVIFRDITEQKRIEEAVRRERDFSAAVLDTARALVIVLDGEGKITRFNRACEEMTGYSEREVLGMVFWDILVPPEDLEGVKAAWEALRAGDFPNKHENHWQGRDGSKRLIAWADTAILREGGEIEYIVGTGIDISQRKSAELALQKLNAELAQHVAAQTAEIRQASAYNRRLIEASLDPLVTISPDGKITDVNAAAESVTGRGRNELVGTDFSDYFTEPEKARAGYEQVFREGFVRDYPLEIRSQDGRVTPVLYNASVYWDESGHVSGIFAAARDITDRRLAEAALQASNELLEQRVAERTAELARSNQDLEQFAYVTSHDLKEPLRMVTGFMSLLKDRYHGKIDPQADEYIGFATEAASRMQALIDDLLAYARVGRGGAGEAIDLGAAVEDALENLKSSIAESGARITRDPMPTAVVNGLELTQVFQNLVGNAIKFRQPGVTPEIHIGAEEIVAAGGPRSGGGPPAHWIFRVRDNGIGIHPEYHDRLFEIFQRLHSREDYPGTGIGLAICKKIIERHGGRIWIESEAGQGATFCFTLPAPKAHPAQSVRGE